MDTEVGGSRALVSAVIGFDVVSLSVVDSFSVDLIVYKESGT